MSAAGAASYHSPVNRALAISYAVLTPVLAAVCAGLYLLVARAAPGSVDPRALLPPLLALVALTAVVWVLMFVVRNIAVALGVASISYYRAYRETEAPSERIERPARLFMNLLEVPVLFYVLCLLMLVTRVSDAAQLALAWAFVGLRVLHAIVYLALNHVPSRLGAYAASCITLAVMWSRFAAQAT